MRAYIKEDTSKSDALWLIIEREVESDNVAHPILTDEVEIIRDACNDWLQKKRGYKYK